MNEMINLLMDKIQSQLPGLIENQIDDGYYEDEIEEIGKKALKKVAKMVVENEATMGKITDRVVDAVVQRALDQEDELSELVVAQVMEKVAEQISTNRVDDIVRAVKLKLPSADRMAEDVIARVRDEEFEAVKKRLVQRGV